MYKNLAICFILGLIFVSQTQSKIKHECQHHSGIFADHKIIQLEEQHDTHRRNLKSSSWEPIRITFDFSELEKLPSDKKEFIPILEQQAKVSAKFFYDNLNVKRISGRNIFPSYYDHCFNKEIAYSDKNPGISNSDLHIYITFTDEPSKSYVAYATPCVQRSGDSRPVFGLVNFNIGYLKVKNFESDDYFEYVNEITLHEITHVLAFSESMMDTWVDPKTGSRYKNSPAQTITNSKGVTENWLTTEKVKAFARQHYNCNSMPGQKLENQGGSGSAGSHWEKVMLENEFMTASTIKHDAVYSQFTFALLEDCGWYMPNYERQDHVEWGKDQGCKFVESCSTSSFREFQPQQVNVCNFHHNSVSKVTSYHSFGDKCMIPSVVSGRLCIDPYWQNYYVPDYQSGEFYGVESACFDSNIQSRTPYPHPKSTIDWYLQFQRCLKHECDSKGNIYVYITGERYKLDKTSNKAYITPKGLNKDIEGYVNGPEDPYAFCNTYPKPCPNFCSKNGYCMGKQCYCIEGYYGVDCSQKGNGGGNDCKDGQFLYNGRCVSECPSGTYKFQDSCSDCPQDCRECSSSANCTVCEYGYYFHKEKCVSQCPQGYFGNTQSNDCEPCMDNCFKCQNSYSCDKCVEDYVVEKDLCVKKCPDNCYSCSSVNVCTTCDIGYVKMVYSSSNVQCLTKCPDGYYKNTGSVCEKCKTGCKKCTSYSNCLDNDDDCKNNQVEFNGKCLEECPEGYYKSGQKCYLCHSSCKTCLEKDTCKSCPSGYSISSSTQLCVKDEQPSGCGEGCSHCSNNECYKCKSGYLTTYIGSSLTCPKECPFGYYKSSTSCYTCDANCKGCSTRYTCDVCTNSSLKKYYSSNGKLYCVDSCPVKSQLSSDGTTCKSCSSSQYYYRGQCVSKCPSGTTNKNRICEESCQNPCDFAKICGKGLLTYKYAGFDLCDEECPYFTQPYDGKC